MLDHDFMLMMFLSFFSLYFELYDIWHKHIHPKQMTILKPPQM
jgi:hypothetical protein